ncbi:hypothetical protein BG006_007783 [Podila minutissima]|uniref:Uncharacterized protein n=1 Tax=Podila minutissima TaxID=64525 RepID=A0A9P5SJB3_9FUNG|nr:hypothetical protein BG006_007783 [Podila minutissima]
MPGTMPPTNIHQPLAYPPRARQKIHRYFIARRTKGTRPDFVMANHLRGEEDKYILLVTIRFFRLTNALLTAVFENFPRLRTLNLEDVPYEIDGSPLPTHAKVTTLVFVHGMVPRAMAYALPILESLTIKADDQPRDIVCPSFTIDRGLFERFVMFSQNLKTVRLERIVLQGRFTPMEHKGVTKVYMTQGVNAIDYFPYAAFYVLEG